MTRDGMVQATQTALGWVDRCPGAGSPFRVRTAPGDEAPTPTYDEAGAASGVDFAATLDRFDTQQAVATVKWARAW